MIVRLLQCLLQYESLLREGRFEALARPPFPPSFGVAHNYPLQTIFWSSLSGASMDAHKAGVPPPQGWYLQGNRFCLRNSSLAIWRGSAGKWSSQGSGALNAMQPLSEAAAKGPKLSK